LLPVCRIFSIPQLISIVLLVLQYSNRHLATQTTPPPAANPPKAQAPATPPPAPPQKVDSTHEKEILFFALFV